MTPDPERAAFYIVHFIAAVVLARALWVVACGGWRIWRERQAILAVARELDEACPATQPSPCVRRGGQRPPCLECGGSTAGGWLCAACAHAHEVR